MARLDHYVNGEWVGSTDVPGHSNVTGWVDTYTTDGNTHSTWVSNPDRFDYNTYHQQDSKQQNSKPLIGAGYEKEAKELVHKWSFNIFYFFSSLGLISIALLLVVRLIYSICDVGVEETFERVYIALNSFIAFKDFLPLLFSCFVWVAIFIIFKVVRFFRKKRK